MKICPKCGAENVDTANFCDECGAVLKTNEVEPVESTGDTEPALETLKEDIAPEENSVSSEVSGSTDVKEAVVEQTEKKEESSPKKKNRLIIGVLVAALICIIGFMATRPRLKSLEVTYTGDTTEGIVLDNNNEGFKVTAVYSNGKEEDVPAGEWQITEPQTLVADEICEIKIKYKNISQDITIECSTTKISYIKATYNGAAYEGTIINNKSDITVIAVCNSGYSFELNRNQWYLTPKEVTLIKDKPENIKLSADFDDNGETVTISTVISVTGIENKIESIEAEYNGSTYEGTVIDQKSDIEVEGKYSDGKVRDIDKKNWSLDPESVTLEDGKTSKLKVIVEQENGKTVSTDLEIKGKEAPLTKPEIEGDHYNCTIGQFVKYINKNTNMSLFEMKKVFGEEYECYGIIPPKEVSEISKEDTMVLALRENEDGKLRNIAIWAADKTTGMATSLQYAQIVDSSFDANDVTQKVNFVTENYYASGDIAIIINEDDGTYFFMILNHDQAKEVLDKINGSIP